eukprot:NODE_1635_length_805_cov_60.416667_g1366_i0.p2 GENE.NODE_1635_length_805_cov_60.416667_g1366_i0~~NODE_1635_length_805_cov_60.416667_g1366_i0.p2  ORF type:complete len:202 (-),score=52.56 NODE_1635_length_805_cov_60.416667_g1366_i0:169-774(-)
MGGCSADPCGAATAGRLSVTCSPCGNGTATASVRCDCPATVDPAQARACCQRCYDDLFCRRFGSANGTAPLTDAQVGVLVNNFVCMVPRGGTMMYVMIDSAPSCGAKGTPKGLLGLLGLVGLVPICLCTVCVAVLVARRRRMDGTGDGAEDVAAKRSDTLHTEVVHSGVPLALPPPPLPLQQLPPPRPVMLPPTTPSLADV